MNSSSSVLRPASLWGALFLFSSAACSDYEVNSLAKDNDPILEAEEEAEEIIEEEAEIVEEEPCVETNNAFDIEEVSVLQDAAGLANGSDAVVMSYDPSGLGPDDTWRVSKVDLLIMIAKYEFDSFTDGIEITAEIFDSAEPVNGQQWSVTQKVYRDDLVWEAIDLPWTAAVAGQTWSFEQYGAWMSFDFTDIIPESGMTSTNYVAGVRWNSTGIPTVGYSNFNLDCSKNWTIYGDGVWLLNSSTSSSLQECSWPMMRIEMETRTLEACEE